jgi:putative DNA primase/helicase
MMQDRLRALVLFFEDKPPAPEYFRLVTPELQKFAMPDLSTLEGQEAIDEVIADAELIFVDSITTLCRTGVENEAESWLPVQDWALRMRREGRSVVFAHHTGKSGDQRGTSRHEDVLDTVIRLTRPKDYSAEDGARFLVTFTKARGVAGDAVKPFEACLQVDDESGRAEWTMREVEAILMERVVELFGDGLSTRQVARELGISPARAHRLKQKAERKSGRSHGGAA